MGNAVALTACAAPGTCGIYVCRTGPFPATTHRNVAARITMVRRLAGSRRKASGGRSSEALRSGGAAAQGQLSAGDLCGTLWFVTAAGNSDHGGAHATHHIDLILRQCVAIEQVAHARHQFLRVCRIKELNGH